jgi:hypothetical protein
VPTLDAFEELLCERPAGVRVQEVADRAGLVDRLASSFLAKVRS